MDRKSPLFWPVFVRFMASVFPDDPGKWSIHEDFMLVFGGFGPILG